MNANKVIQQAADMYGVSVKAVLSPCRLRELADCRTVICYVLVYGHRLTLCATARIIGRTHADIAYHVAKGRDWVSTPRLNPEGSKAIKTMMAEKPP